MKKFVMSLLLAIAIMIPTVTTKAADVPDFRSVAGNYASYAGTQRSNGYISYDYDCDLNVGDSLVQQYMQLLTGNYPFYYLGNEVNDATRSSAQKFVHLYFGYNGSGYAQPANMGMRKKRNPVYCHVSIMVCYYYQQGVERIKIRVADGLSYGG